VNSSTIAAGYQKRNDETYELNRKYYENKMDAGDYSEGSWSVRRRRLLTWD
jgi:hypothetical protein